MIDILLVSPRLSPSDSRYCGDNAYTDTLLQYPPPGVRYYHYEDLMAKGQVRKLKWLYRIGPRLRKWGILPHDLWAEYLVSDFVPDIMHIYGFSAVVRFPRTARPVPVVLGTSTGSYSDLKYYLGWPESRIRRARWLKRQYLRLIDAHDSSLRPEKAASVLVWSEFSKRMHLEEGYVRPDQISVLYPGLPWRGDQHPLRTDGSTTFLFVGRDFVRKNGQLVLDAFRQVRKHYPSSRLIFVSMPPDSRKIDDPGVTHYQFVPRQELIERIYPQADVLVLPSRSEGFGLVLLEAMSYGMPVIAVDAWAMSEIVKDGMNGFLVRLNRSDDLIEKMFLLAESKDRLDRLKQGAKPYFQNRFFISTHNERLREVYEAAQAGRR